jgi:hypothetical protein
MMPDRRPSARAGVFRTLLATAAIGLLALALASCEAERGAVSGAGPSQIVIPSLSREAQSGIQGLVTVGPTCPVERPDSPCPDRAYQTTIIVMDSTGAEVLRAPTDASGQFLISLGPGDYTLTEVTSGVFPRPVLTPVHVAPDAYSYVHIMLDSGIR